MIDFLGVYHSKMVTDLISYCLELIVSICLSSSGDFKNLFWIFIKFGVNVMPFLSLLCSFVNYHLSYF